MRPFGIVLAAVLFLGGCAPKKEELAVYHESSALAAQISAQLEARDKNGVAHLVGDSDSMTPTILPHDWVVSVATPFADLRVGMVCSYFASWNKDKDGKPRLTCHRIVATWPDGTFLMEGDAPKEKNVAETTSYMGASNYVDHVISTHRFP